MLELIALFGGLIGFFVAGYLDLKTTEFPDYLPYSLIALGLAIHGANSLLLASYAPIVNCLVAGGLFLGLGLGLYFTKQWGDGDAWLLGSMGFLYPSGIGGVFSGTMPFAAVLIFNFFIASFAYLIAYSIGLGVKHKLFAGFMKQLWEKSRELYIIFGALFIPFMALVIWSFANLGYGPHLAAIIQLPFLLFMMVIFVYYGRYIEKKVFRKLIPVSKLRLGDVPVGMRWKVIKAKELAMLKKRGGKIWIKEGVRFAPVFALTIIITYFLGPLFG